MWNDHIRSHQAWRSLTQLNMTRERKYKNHINREAGIREQDKIKGADYAFVFSSNVADWQHARRKAPLKSQPK